MRRFLFLTAALALAGCADEGVTLVPVSGTVTLENKPVGGAEVVFLPDPANPDLPPGQDTSGPQGNYKAMSGGRAGLVPGKYKVAIRKSAVDESVLASLPEEIRNDPGMARRALDSRTRGRNGRPASASMVPPKPIEKEFVVQIPPTGGVFDFEIKPVAKVVKR